MPKYKVWESYMEQWDANDIDPPDMEVEARTPSEAAERFAERQVGSDVACIVQDPEGKYYEIELFKKWEVDMYKPTTLEELCSP